jgi:nucleoside-diphosphate-sugar epimerase
MVGRPDLVHLGSLPARPGEPPVLVADVSRLRGETGFQPRFKLEDTLAAALSYWRVVEHT